MEIIVLMSALSSSSATAILVHALHMRRNRKLAETYRIRGAELRYTEQYFRDINTEQQVQMECWKDRANRFEALNREHMRGRNAA